MIRKTHRIFIASFLVLFMASLSCHTPKQVMKQPELVTTFSFPTIELSFSFVAPCSFSLPEPTLESIDFSRKMVTLDFSAREKSQVRVQDPLLFLNSDVEIVNLPFLKDEEYAFPLPGAKVISPYAGRRKSHSGIDLKTFANDTIVAAFDGVVRMAQPFAAYGNVIVVRHYNGLETVYSHNSKNMIKVGDVVKAGQPIALVGRTGRATTEHLHFEIRINGQHFNPDLVFNFETQKLQSKSLHCVIDGKGIKVTHIDPFPQNFASK